MTHIDQWGLVLGLIQKYLKQKQKKQRNAHLCGNEQTI